MAGTPPTSRGEGVSILVCCISSLEIFRKSNISENFTPLNIKFVFHRFGFLFYPNFAII